MEIELMDSIYFTRQNLKLIFGKNRRTLDYRIESLIKKKRLLRLKKGFYLNIGFFKNSNSQKQLLEYLSFALVYPSYLSTEYILAEYGFLVETVFAITCITTKKTRRMCNNQVTYIFKNIKKDLFFGFEKNIVDNYVYYKATLAKALFDYLYLTTLRMNKKEIENLLINSRFNWRVLNSKDTIELNEIIKKSKIKKMQEIYIFLNRKGII